MGRVWRIHHPVASTDPGREMTIEGEEAHHVVRVLRLKAGDPVGIFDGEGNEWRAVIVSAERGRVSVRIQDKLEDEVDAPFELSLYQGLCKADRFEWVIQKATEVGVAAVYAFPTRRCEVRLPKPHRVERWRRIGIEACKQCGRRRVPRVEILEGLPDPPGEGTVGVVLDTAAAAPPLGAIAAGTPPSALWLAVGPEGGFEPDEVEGWAARGWHRAGLGPRVLRADTAGLIAASIFLHRWADLGSRPPAID